MVDRLTPIYRPIIERFLLIKHLQPDIRLTVTPSCEYEIARISTDNPDEEVKEVLCRPYFRKMLSQWNSADIIAGFHALESLRALSAEWLDAEFILPLHKILFDDDTINRSILKKRFYFSDDYGCWYANDKDRKPSLEAAYGALRTAQILLSFTGRKCSLENLDDMLGAGRIQSFEKYLKSCADSTTGGFRDQGEEVATIASTGLAIRISALLQKAYNKSNGMKLELFMNSKFAFDAQLTPSGFISNCCRQREIDGRQAYGFSENPYDEEIWICVSYFAAASLNLLGATKKFRSREYESGFTEFMNSCKRRAATSAQDSAAMGFSANPKFKAADLMHTFYALKFAEILCPKVLQRENDAFFCGIAEFVDSCRVEGGYGFRPHWAPNLFSTCLARNTYDLIRNYRRKLAINYDPVESLTLISNCFAGPEYGFSGYPLQISSRIR
ncbi:MAG: hypothetical protein NT002_05230 [candidate division Zixibacteria bacterium]|nr:hypothetical protein [candidate division Zixibacteria bacterium]